MNWSVKVKLFKALATANPPPPPFHSKVRLDYYWPWLNNGCDEGRGRTVPNPRASRSVGKKLQNCQHFLSKIVDILPVGT